MKFKLIPFVIAFALIFTAAVPAQAAPQTYTFDPNHTYVLWHVSHFGFSNPSGKWLANGTLTLDDAKPQDSKVNVTIKMDSLATGIPELDEHLKGDNFFDIKQFPTATFVSDKVTLDGSKTAKVHGILTVHGVSKPVTLNITLNKVGMSIITNKKTVGFSGSTTLNRSDFGVSTFLPGVGDEVKIEIEAEAN